VNNDTFHLRREDKGRTLTSHAIFGLKVSKEMTKVDVKESTAFGNHDIIGMAITNAEDVGGDTVTRTGFEEHAPSAFILSRILVVLEKERRDDLVVESTFRTTTILDLNIGGCCCVRYNLNHTNFMPRGNTAVSPHLKVEACVAPKVVHEAQKLERELILTEVITILENDMKVIATPVTVFQHHVERQLL
jgi:hypothetical protein